LEKFTIQNLLHLIAVCIADLGIDQACAGLREDDAFHGSGLLGGMNDVLGGIDERVVYLVIGMEVLFH
jgi:hypothetical protein